MMHAFVSHSLALYLMDCRLKVVSIPSFDLESKLSICLGLGLDQA